MAKNLGREFATMDEDERRRFTMEPEGGTDTAPEELDFEKPREERDADPTDRDGEGALLDEEGHKSAVARQRRKAGPPDAA